MASPSSSLSSPLPSLKQAHQEATMAAPLGSPQKPHMSNHGENQTKAVPCRLVRQTSDILRCQHMDVKELRICVGTWNVGGLCPPKDLDIHEWLDMEELADIYVLGFQEIIPLEAGYMIGSEDNSPVAVWEHIIGETLNKECPGESRFKYYSAPSSPSSFNTSDYAHVMEHGFLSETNNDNDGKLHPLIDELDTNTGINDAAAQAKTCTNPTSASNEQKDKDFSRVPSKGIFCQTHETGLEKSRYNLDESNNQNKSTKVPALSKRLGMIWPGQPLDTFARHLQDNTKSLASARHLEPLDLAFDFEIDNRIKRKIPYFIQIVSKQMVGIYLSIWVQKSLQKHIQNLRVSILGVGKTPYIGNKGSVSVSMSIHQTCFCFECCHLAAGEKDGDEQKRNAHVEAIHKRTVFNPVPRVSVPQRINDHERIIWLGDLNYRINLSYERTYKYKFNSQKYVNDETKSGRRTPSWCDRVLSYGKGIKLLSYKRAELTFSGHRPVTAVYMVDTEVLRHRKLERALKHF